ncbi:MAG TPA: hypothetical protein PLX35_14045 [Cyclobacteriaceae bacterium]|nr:hypothetical protein [Cyclobacteriaceae bacterium]
MICRIFTCTLAITCMAACNPPATTQEFVADTIHQEAPAGDNLITREVTFKDVDAVEGNVSLVFTDARGEEVWIARMEDTVDRSVFCTLEENPGTPFPVIKARSDVQGKTFNITYRIEFSDDNPAAQMVQVPVLVRVQPVNK